MILHTLTICNIASIADAVVDFDAEPLRSGEVFLISGSTGAGKSTLLDAICLALFATTPRLSARRNGVKDNGEIAFADPRQLLRRNTGYGWVSLLFTGNDGHRYKAEWSVQRARKNPAGRMQDSVRTLERIDNHYIWNKKAAVDQQIAIATGLDFNRFCRTTMLAQGDFTKFLFCDDKDKAAVLEKLTDTGIYSRVGMEIFNLAKQHGDSWRAALREADSIVALTSRQRQELLDERSMLVERQLMLKACAGSIADYNAHIAAISAMHDKINALRSEVETAGSVLRSESCTTMRRLVMQWNETTVVRAAVAAMDNAGREQDQAGKRLQQYASDRMALISGLTRMSDNLACRRRECESLRKSLSLSSDRKTLLDRAPDLIAVLTEIEKSFRSVEQERLSLGELSRLIEDSLRPAVERADKSVATVREDIARREYEIAALQARIDMIGPVALRTQLDRLNNRLSAIAVITSDMTSLAVAEDSEKRLRQEIDQAAGSLVTLQGELTEAMAKDDLLKSLAEEASRAYEIEIRSINDFARELRRSLTVGCTCPVCMQRVEAALPDESAINRLVDSARQRRDKAQAECQDSVRHITILKAEIERLGKIVERRDELERMSGHHAVMFSALRHKLDQCGLPADSTMLQLKEATEETQTCISDLTARLESAAELEKKLAQLTDSLTDQRSHLSRLSSQLDEANVKLRVESARLEQRTDQCDRLVSGNNEALAGIDREFAAWPEWLGRDGEPLSGRISRIRSQLAAYNEKNDRLHACETELSRLSASVDACVAASAACPELPEVELSGLDDSDTPVCTVEQWSRLSANIAEARSLVERASAARSEARVVLDAFLSANDGYTLDRLRDLDGHKQLFIAGQERKLRSLEDNVMRSRSALARALYDLRTMLRDRTHVLPSLPDFIGPVSLPEDSSAKAVVMATLVDRHMSDVAQRIGAIHNELSRNVELQRRKDELVSHADSLKTEFDRWEALNQLFGSADGGKFRRIALSYVLGALIHSANHFMASLSDRYRLSVDHGSFAINVEDAYQGYAVRPVSTVSGGESFLVSLALALALSDIGQHQGVNMLFIDEGFGTLSGEPLQRAITTLQRLQVSAGRKVGIISHVEELKSRIPVQIRVERTGGSGSSMSTVRVVEL